MCLHRLEHIAQSTALLILRRAKSSKSCWSTGEVLVTRLKTQSHGGIVYAYHIEWIIHIVTCNRTSENKLEYFDYMQLKQTLITSGLGQFLQIEYLYKQV